MVRLKASYPTMIKEELLTKLSCDRWSRVLTKASRLGLRRSDNLPARTGFPLIDAVRSRAREKGLTMRLLDQLAGTGEYFQKARWFGAKEENAENIQKALQVLGGRFVVRWRDY